VKSTTPLSTPVTSVHNNRPPRGRTQKSEEELRLQHLIILDSCHSTWVFDSVRMQFCRILKGIRVADRSVTTLWRPYWRLELDPQTDTFSVYLNASRTRLIRSWQHTQNCGQCGGSSRIAASTLEDVAHAVSVYGMTTSQSTQALTPKPTSEGGPRQRSISAQTASLGPRRQPNQRERQTSQCG
jgi:hypothetical protein